MLSLSRQGVDHSASFWPDLVPPSTPLGPHLQRSCWVRAASQPLHHISEIEGKECPLVLRRLLLPHFTGKVRKEVANTSRDTGQGWEPWVHGLQRGLGTESRGRRGGSDVVISAGAGWALAPSSCYTVEVRWARVGWSRGRTASGLSEGTVLVLTTWGN